MALRVKPDGTLLCAAIYPHEKGDGYINDSLQYDLDDAGVIKPIDGGGDMWRWVPKEEQDKGG